MVSSPWTEEWVEYAKSMGKPPSLPEDFELKKAAVNQIFTFMASLQPAPPEGIMSKDLEIPDGPTVRAYKPTTKNQGPLPMIFFIHGGGWMAGNLDTEDRECRLICSMTESWVVSVDYRCGATITLDTQVDDCHQAFEWARGRAEAHGCDPNKLVIWAGSAGGSLAQALVYRLVQEGKGSHVAGLALMCSLALHPDATPEKYKHLMKSYQENAGPLPFISDEDTYSIYAQRDIVPPKTPIHLFPAAGGPEALRGFPPTYAVTGDNDASRDDMTVLVAMLKDAGIPAKHDNFKGLAHYFWVFNLPKANEEFWEKLSKGILWTLEQERKA